MKGDQELVKKSGRDEPIRFVKQIFVVPTLGISLYSYLYLELAKTVCFSYYLLFSLQNLENRRVERVLRGSMEGGVKKEEVNPNNVYTCY
jgi:hypothetical protein